MAKYDIVIRNGTIHDGEGGAPRVADVAIEGQVIAAIGRIDGSGREEIDATGMLVTPGFVDVHTHYDGQASWSDRLGPTSLHGVTTVVMGNCGVGFAPCRPHQRDILVEVMEGVEDVPEVVMIQGVPWNWETFPDYLDAMAERRLDVDFAAQLPHSALRVYVMGERAASFDPPTADDLARMRELTAEAIRAGAVGISTSRNMLHRTTQGAPIPSLFSEEVELNALAAGLCDAGAGVFQLIPNVDNPPAEEFRLMRRIAEVARRPLSYSLMQLPSGDPEAWRDSIDLMAQAVADGLPIRAQVAPRGVGTLYGLDLSFNPFMLHPSFRAIAQLPLAEKVARMRDPAFRAQLLSEQADESDPMTLRRIAGARESYPLGDPPNYEPDPSERVDRKAAALGKSYEEHVYDLLLERDGRALLFWPVANYRHGDSRAVREMLGDPNTVMALADGGAHYGLVCDSSFPTYFLTRWVRDASGDERFDLADGIAQLTGKPADLVGFGDRGRLKPGYKADVNVIDFDRLTLSAPEMRHDLPAGGKRLDQGAEGYVATIVSGEITYRNGAPTGALPGRLVRGQQSAPAPRAFARAGA
ncbi:amidohydrolase family protein [Sphingomonas sp.]|uniref:N-acyl-D-amino-acid deacylase family protein n=1 Tax=Sphingomonas sp. TaxID=28214 RepID=UPI001EC10D70|nr:amidohydrolase family protein [Sphingomonas sp.]MBX3595026.1 amidohydrolase family protein [Sphingomonas sp.]